MKEAEEPISQEERDAAHNLVHLHQQRMVESFKMIPTPKPSNAFNDFTGNSSLPVKKETPSTNEFRGLIHTENNFDTGHHYFRHCILNGQVLETGHYYKDACSIFSNQEQIYCNSEDIKRKSDEY